jgi:nickel/cobalt transporter (NicO) family protein
VLISSAAAPANPFVTGNQPQEQPGEGLTVPGVFQAVLTAIADWQRAIRRQLTILGREIRENPVGRAFWGFLLLAFGYGALHALGPGHGKIIVVSYFLSHPGKYLHGIVMGQVLTVVHVFSAVIVILSIHLTLKVTGLTTFELVSRHLEALSYGLLTLVGLVLLGKAMYDWRRERLLASARASARAPQPTSLKHGLVTAIATGLVPCPGAALILVFALTQQILWAGLLAMTAVALGMGLTTTAFACLAITSRSLVLGLTARNQALFTAAHRLLAIAGAGAIMAVGLVLFVGAVA